jgi:hypothetical protein
VHAVVGALDRVPDLMRGQFPGERLVLPPGAQAAVADVRRAATPPRPAERRGRTSDRRGAATTAEC